MENTKTIKDLLKKYSIVALRGLIIRCWAVNNAISINELLAGKTLKEVLREADIQEIGSEVNGLSIKTLKDVEIAFEALIDTERRKKQGAVYTPDFIIDYLLQTTVNKVVLKKKINEISICDPACGSGGFLVRAAYLLAKRYGTNLSQVIDRQLVGIDNDPHAIFHAKCLLELLLVLENENPNTCQFNLFCLDTLIDDRKDILKKVKHLKGFDVIVTNPPYVKLQNLEDSYRVDLCDQYSQFIKGSFSLAILFLVAGHKLLSESGCLGYITQNNIFTSLAGEKVREYLQESKCIRRIIDFGHNHIFDNASAYTCLMFLDMGVESGFDFASLWKDANSDSLGELGFSKIFFKELNVKKWRLGKRNHLDNLKKIESVGTPIGKAFDIKVGFATLKDKVYFVREAMGKCVAMHNDKEYPIEKEITQPAVKIAELNNEDCLRLNNLRIIFPYIKVKKHFVPITENDLKRSYPLAYEYLINSKDELLTRDKGKTNSSPWYAWGRTQSMELRGPKLLTKTFSNYPNFIYNESDQLFCNGYAIFMKKNEDLFSIRLTLHDLRLFVNSIIMDYYVKLTSFQLDGNYQCYQKNFIEKFCIPNLTDVDIIKLRKLSQEQRDVELASIYGVDMDDIKEFCQRAGNRCLYAEIKSSEKFNGDKISKHSSNDSEIIESSFSSSVVK